MNEKPEAPAPDALSAGQTGAFAALMDAAMGQAAGALGALLNRPVRLTVPDVQLLTAPALTALFRENLDDAGVTIRQRFSGQQNGVAALAFSSENARHLRQALVGLENGRDPLSAVDQLALAEAGNILLNAAISALARGCGQRLRTSLPDLSLIRRGEAAAQELLGAWADVPGALVLRSGFTIGNLNLTGYLIFLMPERDVKELLSAFERQ